MSKEKYSFSDPRWNKVIAESASHNFVHNSLLTGILESYITLVTVDLGAGILKAIKIMEVCPPSMELPQS